MSKSPELHREHLPVLFSPSQANFMIDTFRDCIGAAQVRQYSDFYDRGIQLWKMGQYKLDDLVQLRQFRDDAVRFFLGRDFDAHETVASA